MDADDDGLRALLRKRLLLEPSEGDLERIFDQENTIWETLVELYDKFPQALASIRGDVEERRAFLTRPLLAPISTGNTYFQRAIGETGPHGEECYLKLEGGATSVLIIPGSRIVFLGPELYPKKVTYTVEVDPENGIYRTVERRYYPADREDDVLKKAQKEISMLKFDHLATEVGVLIDQWDSPLMEPWGILNTYIQFTSYPARVFCLVPDLSLRTRQTLLYSIFSNAHALATST